MAVSDQGLKLGVQLARGRTLRGGDKLLATDGTVIEVLASAETMSRVELSDSLLLARICYHLGNRHVPLEIGAGFCQFQHDHVLDDMVVGLGGHVDGRRGAKVDAGLATFSGGGGGSVRWWSAVVGNGRRAKVFRRAQRWQFAERQV